MATNNHKKALQELLNKVADHIESVGWHQGAFYRDPSKMDTSPCCVIGAINSVFAEKCLHNYYAYQEVARRAKCSGLLSEWNDTPGRTQAEVLAMLRGEGQE